jgi:hypothetical protein
VYTITQQNSAGKKQKSYKIMRMNMSVVYDKAKPDIVNIIGLNLAVVKLTTVRVTKLPLKHKIRKIGMICFAVTVLTALVYNAKERTFSKMLQPIFSSERILHKDYDHKGSAEKKTLVMTLSGLDAKA